MRRNTTNIRTKLAVTEIIGTMLMLVMATSSFTVVYYNVVSVPTPNPAPIVELSGMIDDNQVIVTHRGGVPLDLDTELTLNVGGTQKSFRVRDFLDSKSKEDGVWGLSEKVVFPLEYDFDYSVYPNLDINIIDRESNSILMTGITKINPTCDLSLMITVDNFNPEEFEIIDALETFSFGIKICKDIKCEEKTRMFLKGNKIYIDYISDVEDFNIEVKLIYPDESSKSINLPSSMTAKQIDLMPIEELESLACSLTPNQLTQWTGSGYDGSTYVKLKLNEK